VIRTRKDPGRSATLSGYTRLGKLIAGGGGRLPFIRWHPQFRFRTFCLLREEPTGDDARSRLCAICRVQSAAGTQGHRNTGRGAAQGGNEHRAPGTEQPITAQRTYSIRCWPSWTRAKHRFRRTPSRNPLHLFLL
jgi:hypothetical protein